MNLFVPLIKIFRLFIVRTGRFPSGRSIGIITADPNPIREFSRPGGLGMTTLEWSSLKTKAVEIHVGAPDGPLFQRSETSGKAVTGEWVHDGMIFYLQDVTDGLALTFANTLDIVRVATKRGFVAVIFSLVERGKKKIIQTAKRYFR